MQIIDAANLDYRAVNEALRSAETVSMELMPMPPISSLISCFHADIRLIRRLLPTAGSSLCTSGIARSGADIIAIDGFRGGTGAAPSRIRDHVGIPIELALAWHRILPESSGYGRHPRQFLCRADGRRYRVLHPAPFWNCPCRSCFPP